MINTNFLRSLVLLAGPLSAQITSPAPYCDGKYDDGFMPVPHYISKVSLGTLTNTSGNTQYTGQHYVYYNNLTAPNLVKNSTYTLNVTHDGGTTIHFLAVYIDFNKDNDFADAGERVLQKTINDPSAIPNPAITQITIPSGASTGITRMRVMVFEDDDYTWAQNNLNAISCTNDAGGFFDWGETEDYNVNITTTSNINETESLATHTYLFPNPASHSILIENNGKETIREVSIIDYLGKEVPLQSPFNTSEKRLDINYLSSGGYFLKITLSSGENHIHKFIKN